MYELFESNEQDESLLLLAGDMDGEEAMNALEECDEPHCQVELFTIDSKYLEEYRAIRKHNIFKAHTFAVTHGRYDLIATKHNGRITKFY